MPEDIDTFRRKFPQYDDLTDTELVGGLHAAFYADLQPVEVATGLGLVEDLDADFNFIGYVKPGALKRTEPESGVLPTLGRIGAAIGEGFTETAAEVQDLSPETRRLFGQDAPGALGSFNRAVVAPVTAGISALAGAGEAVIQGAGQVVEEITGDPGAGRRTERDLRGLSLATGIAASPAALAVRPPRPPRAIPAPTQAQQILRSFEEIGVDPNLPAVMQNRRVGLVAKQAQNVPIVGETITEGAATGISQTARAAERITKIAGEPQSALETGGILQQGVRGFKSRLSTKADKLYKPVNEKMTGQPVALTKSTEAIEAAFQRFSDPELNELFKNPKIAKTFEIISEKEGALSFDDVRQLRRDVWKLGKNDDVARNIDQAALDNVYGALTDDLATAVERIAPEQLKRWKAAEGLYSAGINNIRVGLKKITGAATDEKAWTAFRNATKRDGGDIQLLKRIRASLTADEWGDLVASHLDSLGRKTPGQFSPLAEDFSGARFLTQYAGLSGEAKNILFTGSSVKGLKRQLGHLVTVLGAEKELGKLANHSNTLQSAVPWATAAAFFAEPVITTTALATGFVAGKLMFHPPFVRWMAGNVKKPVTRASTKPAESALRSMARTAPAGVSAEIIQLADSMKSGVTVRAGLAAAADENDIVRQE